MKYDILEIKKYDEKINESIHTVVSDVKFIAISALALFGCEKGLFDKGLTGFLAASGVSVSTLAIISLVKSICNIYINNNKKKELENDRSK